MSELIGYAPWLLYGAMGVQVLIYVVAAGAYLRLSNEPNPLVLGAIVGGFHLLMMALVAGTAAFWSSPDAKLAWVAACLLDLPATFLYPRFEATWSVGAFFAVFGTIQYGLIGIALGVAGRFAMERLLPVVILVALLAAPQAGAAGARTHMEIGKKAVEMLAAEESIVPGFTAFRADEAAMRAFYSGCTFPDFGQDGINPEAAEAAHWYPYHRAYFELMAEAYPPPWNDETRRSIAFFLGVLCHGVADVPWHFDDGANISLMSASKREEQSHLLDYVGDIFAHIRYPDIGMAGKFVWVKSEAQAAFERAGVKCSPDDLERGCPTQERDYMTGARFAPIVYPASAVRWPWTLKHMDGYYYGGVDHAAALSAMCMRYYMAQFLGWRIYQNIPIQGASFPQGKPYLPLRDSAEEKPRMVFNGESETPNHVIVDGLEPPAGGTVGEAFLYLRFAGRGDGKKVDNIEISAAAPGEESTEPVVARAVVAPSDKPGKWLAWDVTPQIQAALASQSKACTIELTAEPAPGQAEVWVDSCAAFRTGPEEDAGGTGILGKPILIVR